MHVGIVAACLPTLKPMFAQFFGQLSTYAFSRDRTGRSAGRSQPFRSKGYMKQGDSLSQGQDSFAMKSIGGASQVQSSRIVAEGQGYGNETYRASVMRTSSRRWRRQNQTGDSDENILGHCDAGQPGVPSGMVIVRTTEVDVTS